MTLRCGDLRLGANWEPQRLGMPLKKLFCPAAGKIFRFGMAGAGALQSDTVGLCRKRAGNHQGFIWFLAGFEPVAMPKPGS